MKRHSACCNRRDLLAGAVGLAAATAWRPLFAARASRWFKIGACEWSLRAKGTACFEVARQIGLDGVQVDLGREPTPHLLQADVQQQYLAAAKQSGLEIASLAIGVFNQIPLKSDPQAAAWFAESLVTCCALGLKLVMPAFFGRGDLDMAKTDEIDRVVQILKEQAPHAEKMHITIGLENYLSAADNMKILDRVGSPAVKVYYDVGNSTDKGRDVAQEIRQLGPLICEFHAKDKGFMLGQGRIDFRKVRAAIDDVGYSGWIHLEATAPHGLVADYTAHKNYLRGIFPERA